MRIPSFVPMIESERRTREWSGFIIEVLVWGYIALVAGRIIWWDILLPFIEGYAIDDAPRAWATSIVSSLEYDSRYSEFSWTAAGSVFGVGALIGILMGLTGRGFGPWVASLSKLQVNNPEDSIRIRNHWTLARREGWLVLALTILTGWVLTRIQLGKMVELVGLQSFGRLVLQLSCGLPIIGQPLSATLEFVLNGLVGLSNAISGMVGSTSEVLPRFNLECVPSDASYYGLSLIHI
jgi:phosphonate transport system permease protein